MKSLFEPAREMEPRDRVVTPSADGAAGWVCRFFPILLFLLLTPRIGRAPEPFIPGADLSSLDEVEAAGACFSAADSTADPARILRDAGLGWARLRLWHSPKDGRDDLPQTLALARRLRAEGFRLLLDLHLSDGWADPNNQTPPRAWRGLEQPVLEDSLRAYVSDVVRAFAEAACLPGIIQLGNEIDGGLLWPTGYVTHDGEHPEFWDRLADLLKAAREGLAEAAGDSVKVMVHLANATDVEQCLRFCRELEERDFDFDLLGLSYYPWLQGELIDLQACLQILSERLDKDLVVVEAAYPWTLDGHDAVHNLIGDEEQLQDEYPATAAEQREFLESLKRSIRLAPRGRGLFYWEPAWISTPLTGSPWENCALFDFDGRALPALDALGASP